MNNFVAFDFSDNDFHEPLGQAIKYVAENSRKELTADE